MGTRHIITVIQNDERKVAQYGHWDGDLIGVGMRVLHFMRDPEKVSALRNHLPDCKYIEGDTCHEDAMDIIEQIAAGEVSELEKYWSTWDDMWDIEYIYAIDFDLNCLTIYPQGYCGKSYPLWKLPTDKRFLEDFREHVENVYNEYGISSINEEYGTDFKKQSREDLPLF